MKCVETLVGQD